MPVIPFIPAIIGGATSLIGGLTGQSAAKSAAAQQQAAAQQIVGMAKDTTSQAQGRIDTAEGTLSNMFAPYQAAGVQGVNSLAAGFAPGGTLAQAFTPPNPQDISSTPEYQFQLQQGTQALDRSAAARGEAQGGGQMKAITQFGQGLASTAYQQAYNNALNTFQTNHNNSLNGLLALSGIGQNATNVNSGQILAGAQDQGQFGMQGLNVAAGATAGGANAGAQGTLNAANSFNSMISGLGTAGIGAINTFAGLPSRSPVTPSFNPGSGPGYGYGPTLAQLGAG